MNTNWNKQVALEHGTLYDNFSAAVQWLSAQGVLNQTGRISQYYRVLADLVNDTISYEQILNKYDPEIVFSALYDTMEIVEIYELLKQNENTISKTILRNIVKGPVSYTDEKAENSLARNTVYEL